MTWREAFLVQAASDLEIFDLLRCQAHAHQLHYLQMLSEKLAKAYLAPDDGSQPKPVHAAFVRFLQTLKTLPEIRSTLRFKDSASFGAFIDSLLPLAKKIEGLAPESTATQPNPEYPWRSTPGDPVRAPALYVFKEFDPESPRMRKLIKLIRDVLRVS